LRCGAFTLSILAAISVWAQHRSDLSDPYSHANQEAFVGGCEHSGGSDSTCRCAFNWIKQNVSAEDYKAYGKLVMSPSYTASQTPNWVYTAMHTCVAALRGAPS
jgi:hypothetical protein